MKPLHLITLFLVLSALGAGCLFPPGSAQPPAASGNESTANLRQAIANESFRLESLSFQRNLTASDLSTLRSLVAQDDAFSDEFKELEWMMEHNYPKHAGHSLGGIAGIALNQSLPCPADALSHVGIFMAANETTLAAGALEDAKSSLDSWTRLVAAAQARDPTAYNGSRELLAIMRKEIADADAGNVSAVTADAAIVDATGYC